MSEATEGIPEPSWDREVARLGGGILQSAGWAALQAELGRPTYYASGRRWAWLALLRAGTGIRYLYAPYGPAALDANAMQVALESLYKLAQDLHADFVRFEPVGLQSIGVLKRYGAKQIAEVQPRRTLILNLNQSAEELRHGISSSNRNLINSAPRRGIQCRQISRPGDSQVATFISMMHDTVARNSYIPYPDDYYEKTIKTLGARGAASLYLGFKDGHAVAGAVAFDFDTTRYYAHAAAFQGSNREHKVAPALLWQMILDAKNQGRRSFDFWGIADADDPAHPRAGLTRFKRSFGGRLKEYLGTWDLPVKPLKYHVYRAAKNTLRIVTNI